MGCAHALELMGVPSQGTLTQFTKIYLYFFPYLQAQSYIITFLQVDDSLPSPSFDISKYLSLSLSAYMCVYIYAVYTSGLFVLFPCEQFFGNKSRLQLALESLRCHPQNGAPVFGQDGMDIGRTWATDGSYKWVLNI